MPHLRLSTYKYVNPSQKGEKHPLNLISNSQKRSHRSWKGDQPESEYLIAADSIYLGYLESIGAKWPEYGDSCGFLEHNMSTRDYDVGQVCIQDALSDGSFCSPVPFHLKKTSNPETLFPTIPTNTRTRVLLVPPRKCEGSRSKRPGISPILIRWSWPTSLFRIFKRPLYDELKIVRDSCTVTGINSTGRCAT